MIVEICKFLCRFFAQKGYKILSGKKKKKIAIEEKNSHNIGFKEKHHFFA
jgi:hypothetical protein